MSEILALRTITGTTYDLCCHASRHKSWSIGSTFEPVHQQPVGLPARCQDLCLELWYHPGWACGVQGKQQPHFPLGGAVAEDAMTVTQGLHWLFCNLLLMFCRWAIWSTSCQACMHRHNSSSSRNGRQLPVVVQERNHNFQQAGQVCHKVKTQPESTQPLLW